MEGHLGRGYSRHMGTGDEASPWGCMKGAWGVHGRRMEGAWRLVVVQAWGQERGWRASEVCQGIVKVCIGGWRGAHAQGERTIDREG